MKFVKSSDDNKMISVTHKERMKTASLNLNSFYQTRTSSDPGLVFNRMLLVDIHSNILENFIKRQKNTNCRKILWRKQTYSVTVKIKIT